MSGAWKTPINLSDGKSLCAFIFKAKPLGIARNIVSIVFRSSTFGILWTDNDLRSPSWRDRMTTTYIYTIMIVAWLTSCLRSKIWKFKYCKYMWVDLELWNTFSKIIVKRDELFPLKQVPVGQLLKYDGSPFHIYLVDSIVAMADRWWKSI